MPPHHHVNGVISGHTIMFQLSVFVALHFEVEIGALHLSSGFVDAPKFLCYGCDWPFVFTVNIQHFVHIVNLFTLNFQREVAVLRFPFILYLRWNILIKRCEAGVTLSWKFSNCLLNILDTVLVSFNLTNEICVLVKELLGVRLINFLSIFVQLLLDLDRLLVKIWSEISKCTLNVLQLFVTFGQLFVWIPFNHFIFQFVDQSLTLLNFECGIINLLF